MKRERIIVCFVLAVIILQYSVEALSDSGLKEIYKPKETIIGELKGNILQGISSGQIELRRENVLVPFEGDIKNLDGRYFFWIISPEIGGNYTLWIREILSTVNGKPEIMDYEKNFSVNGSRVDYNIAPGVVSTKENFEINSYLFLDDKKEIITEFPDRNVLLNPGDNIVKFEIGNVNQSGLVLAKFGDYTIPILVIKQEVQNQNIPEVKMRFKPQAIKSTILRGEKEVYPFQIVNYGSEEETFHFETDNELFSINSEQNETIGANETLEFNITLKSSPEGRIISVIYAKWGNNTISMPIEIEVTEDEKNASTNYISNNSSSQLYYCASQNGVVCQADELCSSNEVLSLDGKCCLGTCSAPAGKSYKWIGYLLGGIAILILIFAWFKYKQSKGSESEIMKRRVKEAERKM